MLQKRYEGFLKTPCLWKDAAVLNLHQFEIESKSDKIKIDLDENLRLGKYVELFCDIKYHKGIILKHSKTRQEVFLTHGHQADWWNYTFWKWSRFLVRILWKPLNVMGIADPTSPAKNYKELIKVERRTKKWITENNNLITIVGHTHRPRFPEPGDIAFFNDGSCVHPRSITGIEIENGAISLIKWQIATTEDGTLQIVRVLLEGPRKLVDYRTN